MDETKKTSGTEAEALFGVFEAARTKALDAGMGRVPTADLVIQADHAGCEAVAARVRADDAARGGTLSAEEIAEATRDMTAGDSAQADWLEMWGDRFLDHLAAQGREIASLREQVRALTAERDDERRVLREVAQALGFNSHPDSMVTFARTLRARVAELEAEAATWRRRRNYWRRLAGDNRSLVQEWAGALGLGTGDGYDKAEAIVRAKKAAESALATLRQAVEDEVSNLRRVNLPGPADRLSDALSATPSEHPDTAALRAIRERAKDNYGLTIRKVFVDAWRRVPEAPIEHMAEDVLKDVVAYLLGDSGPSGGGEALVGACRWCGAASETDHGDHCPKRQPTTPPDAGASEANTTPEEGDFRLMGAAEALEFLSSAPSTANATKKRRTIWRSGDIRLRRAKTGTHLEVKTPSGWMLVGNAGVTGMWMLLTISRLATECARLREAPRRAAEDMRERCAALADKVAADALRRRDTADVDTSIGRVVYQTAEAQWDVVAPLAEDIRALPLPE